MNNTKLAVLSIFCITALYADRNVTPTIATRSQGRDATRKLVGVSGKVHQEDAGQYYFFSAMPESTHTFRSSRLAECLFGDDLFCDDCGNIIKIQGSDVASRDAKAWLADYFYLAPDYDATFAVKPEIQNILVDLDFYVGLDEWREGLYFRLHGPVTWTRWNLNFCEPCDTVATGSFVAGYFSHDTMGNTTISESEPLETFGEFASGDSPINTPGTALQPSIGVAFHGLKYGKMERGSRDRTGFADLRAELGCNCIQREKYQIGFNFQLAAPTGNKRDAEFVFDPTVGNGNHWEVGGGMRAQYRLWQSKDEDKSVSVFLDANVTHMVTAREQRTFDLRSKPNSRYMLAQKLGRPVNFLSGGSTVTATSFTSPIAQFKGVLAPVANLTTVNVNVRANIQADIVAMVNYRRNAWEWDLGYNFWARSCEKISLPDRPTNDCCVNLCTGDKDVWALKGDAHMFGFMSAAGTTLGQREPIPLSATQDSATIHKGTNADADVTNCTGIDSLQNCGIDNALFAYGEDDTLLTHDPAFTSAADAIKTSVEPLFINCCDISFQPTRGLSHKLFTHLSYTWESNSWTPFFGAGASVEFGNRTSDDCCQSTVLDCSSSCATSSSCCTVCNGDCLDCALSQWTVWVKGGVTFD